MLDRIVMLTPLRQSVCFILCFLCFLHPAAGGDGPVLARREAYDIPLMKLSLIHDGTAIRIRKNGSLNYTDICVGNDFSVERNRKKVEKTTYREPSSKAYQLSDFEALQLKLVCKSLIATLEEHEKNLKNGKWGQCLYLDAFLPKFIHNFYLLIGASRDKMDYYRKVVSYFDNEYDISLKSFRSDERVNLWQNTPDCVLKLRIATKELTYQLKHWIKKELGNKNRNPQISLSLKTEEALNLFVRLYFGLTDPAFCTLPEKGRFYR